MVSLEQGREPARARARGACCGTVRGMRNRIIVTTALAAIAVATVAIAGCSSSNKSTNAVPGVVAPTTAVMPTETTVVETTTIPVETTVAAETTAATDATTVPGTTAPKTTSAPKTTTTAPKNTATTQVPQTQLTGTPQEQANQVVAALAKVAAIQDYGTRTLKLYSLKQSVSSYGITISEDPGTRLYTISAGGQTACFLWDYVDIANSDAEGLVRHACS